MAARLNPRQDDRTRSAIQTTQLVKRLQSFALGQKDPQTKKQITMTVSQVRAALGLMAKTLPDLRSVEHSGPNGEAIPVGITVSFVRPLPDAEG